ncbi:glycine zipper family protein [Gracilibacillus dipsosauri]|uniref:glycine zipper family protein n=1 Tax=Gracilibacillus dipsosauri TaxID=178340 RepID=UPI002409356C
MKLFKKTIVALLSVLVLFIATGSQVVSASTPQDEIFKVTYGDYQDENVFYHIDYIDPTELEDEGFWDKFKIFSNLKDGVVGFFYNLLHEIFVALPFFMMKTATTAMIWLFNKIYEVNFVDAIVGEIASSIQSIAGISGSSFSSSGLFGGFLGIITITIALYTLYQFAVKRASISAFSGLLKSLIALVLALVFFSNYTTLVTGLNKLSVEASGMIVSGGIDVNSDGNITDSSAQDEMNTTLWNTFVHQPYLMLQYGTMDQSAIGNDRVKDLMTKKPDSEERYNLVKEEILDNGNDMMTRDKMFERWGILMIAGMANAFNSLPVLLLAFALLFFQFWFTAMAMVAPFAFIWSAFPNQFGVLARYLLELITPLVLKLAVSVLALVVFSLTSVISNVAMTTLNEQGLLAYIFVVFIQGILFFTIFLLRKRILNIFSMGSKQLQYIREGMSNTFVQPAKKGIQGTTTAVGTVAGAVVGGPQGALIGSSIGSSVGQTMTGDKSLGDAGRDVALNYSMYENMQHRQKLSDLNEQNEEYSKDNVISQTHQKNEDTTSNNTHDLSNEHISNETNSIGDSEYVNNNYEEELNNSVQSDRDYEQSGNEDKEDLDLNNLEEVNSQMSVGNDQVNNPSEENVNNPKPQQSMNQIDTSSSSVHSHSVEQQEDKATNPVYSPTIEQQGEAEGNPVQSIPVEHVNTESDPIHNTPVQSGNAESNPVRTTPVQSGNTKSNPVNSQSVNAGQTGSNPVGSQQSKGKSTNVTSSNLDSLGNFVDEGWNDKPVEINEDKKFELDDFIDNNDIDTNISDYEVGE